MFDLAALVAGTMYVGYAAVVYRRLRTSSELQAEIIATRSWARCTPPWHLFAALILPALPLIADLSDQWVVVADGNGYPAVAARAVGLRGGRR